MRDVASFCLQQTSIGYILFPNYQNLKTILDHYRSRHGGSPRRLLGAGELLWPDARVLPVQQCPSSFICLSTRAKPCSSLVGGKVL